MSLKKRVLFITYHFPPDLTGVRRVLKFVHYLPEFGWQPVVLTVKHSRIYGADTTPLEQLKERQVKIYRAGSLDPYRLAYIWTRLFKRRGKKKADFQPKPVGGTGRSVLTFLRRWLLLPDEKVLWAPFAIIKALSILKQEKIPVFITTSYPNSTHIIGLVLKLLLGRKVKWVADFRDGWTQNPVFFDPPTWLHRKIQQLAEKWTIQRADRVVAVSPPITAHFRTIAKQPEKCLTITNGYDEKDYEGLAPLELRRFTITYTGTFYGRRSPAGLLRALAILLREQPGLANDMQLSFLSLLDREYQQMIEELNLSSVVQVLGLLDYQKCLQYQLSSHLLVIILAAEKNENIMVTQKVFEYLYARRPILAIVPPGECERIVQETGAGKVVRPNDIEGIKSALLHYYQRWKQGQIEVRFKTDIKKYSRRELTRQLAVSFDSLV